MTAKFDRKCFDFKRIRAALGPLGLAAAMIVIVVAAAPTAAQPAGRRALIQGDAGAGLARGHWPWPRRARRGVSIEAAQAEQGGRDADAGTPKPGLTLEEIRRLGLLPRRGGSLVDWPPEPAAPARVALDAFSRALAELCPPEAPIARLAREIVRSAADFDVDPFLLAALIYQQSRCDPRAGGAYGIGLARINPGMFARGMRPNGYRYGIPNGRDGFAAAELRLETYPFTPDVLRAAAPNTYFAAALLHVFSEQCPAIDARFDSVPHRHFVSHFIWGDRVRSTLPEDEILIARRRLLHYYAPRSLSPLARVGSVALSSPLDGAPRLVIGVMGEPRDAGRRIHLGIDFGAALGEPIRAIAGGIVSFAGADMRGRLIDMDPERGRAALGFALGPRGLFVKIRHQDGVESVYAHLSRYFVQTGQHVARGEVLGRVGRSGVRTSDAHLHFGLFVDELAVDPLPILRAYSVRAIRAGVPATTAAQP